MHRGLAVNNVACVGKEYAMGPIDGVQDIVTINHFSPFLFTDLVLPPMKKTTQSTDADIRIVNVASEAHRFVSKLLVTTQAFYGFTKLSDILWMKELARHLMASTDDGVAVTESAFAASAKARWPFPAILCFTYRTTFRPPAEGAVTVLIAAASQDLRREKEKYHSGYLVPTGGLSSPNKHRSNEELVKDLWALTEKILTDERL